MTDLTAMTCHPRRRMGAVAAGLAALLLLVVACVAAFAQSAGSPAALAASHQAVIDGWRATLTQTEAALTRDGLTLNDLNQQRDRVQSVLTGARAFKAQVEPRLTDLEAQISAIAPPPPEGSTETAPALPAEVQKVYDQLETERQTLATLVGQANVLILQGTQILDQIAARREAFFNARLFDRSASVLSPALWQEVGAGIPVVARSVGRVLGGWLDRVAASSNAEVILLFLAALAGAILVVFVRYLFVRWTHAWTAKQDPTPQRKILMAGGVVLADIGVPMLILLGFRAMLAGLGLLPVGIGVILDGIIIAVAAFTVITGMARALAAPGRPQWRIGGISDETARHAYRVVGAAAFLIALGPLADHLAQVAAMDPSWSVGVGGILSVPTALLALYATRILVRGRASLSEDESARSARWRSVHSSSRRDPMSIPQPNAPDTNTTLVTSDTHAGSAVTVGVIR